ncbi:MAG: hypothetical protein H6594_02020 [Flavobacteriales bacterium]|nr:hypothetical protein [Flavobacteriales bacterium]
MKRTGSLCLLVCVAAALHAQNDGDHTITNLFGQTYLATDGIATSTPANMTIGTTPNSNATLNVRGDQLPAFDQFVGTSLCTFRTDVPSGNNQNWSMVRGALEIGRIYHTNPNHSLSLEARNMIPGRTFKP